MCAFIWIVCAADMENRLLAAARSPREENSMLAIVGLRTWRRCEESCRCRPSPRLGDASYRECCIPKLSRRALSTSSQLLPPSHLQSLSLISAFPSQHHIGVTIICYASVLL